jgi:formylglycine-generating enzyme required for sulfatase activity
VIDVNQRVGLGRGAHGARLRVGATGLLLVAACALAQGAVHDSTLATVMSVDGIDFRFRAMPGATFVMGAADSAGAGDAGWKTTIAPFLIMEHEVTQRQYQAIMHQRPSYFAGREDHPVERVSWRHAALFCNRLSARDGRDSCYVERADGLFLDSSRNGYRLPFEAEWEYACGEPPRGAALAEVAWFAANAGLRTHPVKTRQPNAFGLYDMLGNVWEWCTDWYAPRGDSTTQRGAGPVDREAKVVRGGGWWNIDTQLDARHRSYTRPDYRFKFLGFRCVLSRDVQTGHDQ